MDPEDTFTFSGVAVSHALENVCGEQDGRLEL